LTALSELGKFSFRLILLRQALTPPAPETGAGGVLFF